MKIIIAGATGFIGRSLIPALLQAGYQLTVISRDIQKAKKIFPNLEVITWEQLNTLLPDAFDTVINLAGENIADARWTKKRKNNLINSRIDTTHHLVQWLTKAKNKPHLYNASAVGIYPASTLTAPQYFTEETLLPEKTNSFATELVKKWEAATLPAIAADASVTLLRFAVVLKRKEGILNKLEWPFALGLGSVLGKGSQMFTWIHINDLVNAIIFLLKNPEIIGPINLCASECVTQKVFAQTLARAMHRPLLINMPAWVIKIIFGQMGIELLLSGENVRPERLEKLGFKFVYPILQGALEREFNG